MNKIFKYGSIDDIPMYRCSAKNNSEDWSKLHGIKRPYFGTLDIIFGIVVNLLYIPIICVMFRKDRFKLSCFKIMIFLAIVDMLALTVNSIITGFLAVKGAVYCTYPKFIYCAGMCGLGLWCCSCILALLLILSRILALSSRHYSRILFTGYRTYLMLLIPTIYSLFFMFFTHPVTFSSKNMAWLFDPLIFPNKKCAYTNIPHAVNNMFVVVVTCLCYVFLCFSIRSQISDIRAINSHAQFLTKNVFLQSALICVVNQVAAIVYAVMNYIEVPLWIVMLGQIFWQLSHGAPVGIYLSLNRTIRRDFMRILGFAVKPTRGTHFDGFWGFFKEPLRTPIIRI